MSTLTEMNRTAAEKRVNASETLSAASDLLLNYDWSNQDEHLYWVARAPEADILHWVETCRRDQRAEESLDA